MRRKDLMARVRMYDDSLVSRDELAGGKPFRIHARAGRCDEGYFGFQSPARDVELAVRFKIAMQPQQTQYANIFQVALVDRDYLQRNRLIEESDKPLEVWQQKAILMVGVARDADGASQVYMSFGNRIGSYWNDTPAVDLSSPREFEFRLVRVGDFAEAQIDGVTVVRTPVPQSTRHHAVYMNIGGADVTVDSIHFSALEAAE